MNVTLHDELLRAHACGDKQRLVDLYQQAASDCENEDERAFFFVQAYIFALDTAHPDEARLRQKLKAMGREN